jgi:hypothetical protein
MHFSSKNDREEKFIYLFIMYIPYQLCPFSNVLAALMCPSCSDIPDVAILFWKPFPGSPVLAVLFCLPSHACPLLSVPFWLSSSSYPVLAACLGYPALSDFSRQSCPDTPVLAALS